MPKIVLGENLRHALKERALPGFYWGITVGGALFALMAVATARGAERFEVALIIFSGVTLIGLMIGALLTYLWQELRSSSRLPDSESGRTWKIVPAIFGILGVLLLVLLNGFFNSNANQKDQVTLSLIVTVALFFLNFILAGSGFGSLSWLGVTYVRNSDWTLPKPPVWRPVSRSAAPFGGPPPSGPLQRVRSHLGGIALVLLALLLFGLGVLGVIWMTTPYTPTKPNPAAATLVPATAAIIVLPSPMVLPTATSAPTVPPVPAPPTGAPIAQPTVAPVVSTAAPTKVSTVAPKPTVANTAVPATLPPCTYTTTKDAPDTWTTIAGKMKTSVSALMQANPGKNPAAANQKFISPLPSTQCK